jgi:hypothetical protein
MASPLAPEVGVSHSTQLAVGSGDDGLTRVGVAALPRRKQLGDFARSFTVL